MGQPTSRNGRGSHIDVQVSQKKALTSQSLSTHFHSVSAHVADREGRELGLGMVKKVREGKFPQPRVWLLKGGLQRGCATQEF